MVAQPPRYIRVADLARGGMGTVELVVRRDGSFVRTFACKRMHSVYAHDRDVAAMFVQEARIAGLIRHPNVVPVLDVGDDAEGPFLVMELIEGVSAWELLRESHDRGALLPIAVVVEIARNVAAALAAAHETLGEDGTPLGVIHRDVSPQNVIVGFDGLTRLTDFGIARALDAATQTATGVLKGKTGYMSPEQIRYEVLDARCDLFALGVVVWELLAGRRLYAGMRDEVFRRILSETAPDVRSRRSDAPDALATLVAELLEPTREARPASAREVSERLDAIARALPEAGTGVVVRWLGAHFADKRAQFAALVRQALSGEVDTGGGLPRDTVASSAPEHFEPVTAREGPAPDVLREAVREPARPRKKRWLAVSAAAVVAIAVGAIAAIQWVGFASPRAAAPSASRRVRAQASTPTPAPSPTTARAPAAAEASTQAPTLTQSPTLTQTQAQAPSGAPARRRRRLAPRLAPSAEPERTPAAAPAPARSQPPPPAIPHWTR